MIAELNVKPCSSEQLLRAAAYWTLCEVSCTLVGVGLAAHTAAVTTTQNRYIGVGCIAAASGKIIPYRVASWLGQNQALMYSLAPNADQRLLLGKKRFKVAPRQEHIANMLQICRTEQGVLLPAWCGHVQRCGANGSADAISRRWGGHAAPHHERGYRTVLEAYRYVLKDGHRATLRDLMQLAGEDRNCWSSVQQQS